MKQLFIAVYAIALAAASPAAAGVIHVEINQLTFSPAKVSAHVGDTMEWTNKDFVDHSATAKNNDWDVALPAHGSGKLVLKKTGHFDYYCKYHPTMTGEVDISP